MLKGGSIRILLAVICIAIAGAAVAATVDTGSASKYAPSSGQYESVGQYSISLRDSELKEALRFLARVAGLNIILPEELTGVVNIDFLAISPMDAMNSIIRANGLDYAIERGVLRVGKTGQFSTTGEDLKTETIRLKYATARDLIDKVRQLLSERGSVLADDRTNSIIVRERLANIESIKRVLNDVDIRDSQVLIEAKIVEVTRDFSRALGIQWGINNAGNRVNVTGLQGVGLDDANRALNVNLGAANPTSGLGVLIGRLAGGTNIDIQISAAEQRGDARIISEPSIVTSNGVAAKIRSGETMLIKTTGDLNIGAAGVSGDTGLHEIETGVELNVTPQISVSSLVKLKIKAETSQPDFTREVEGIPTIVGNTASTEVLVLDGQTTVIGGLFKFTGTDTVKAVPFFSQIPVLGNIFKSKTNAKRNTELMIFIRPSIVKPADELMEHNALAERADEMKQGTIVEPIKDGSKRKAVKNTSDTRVPADRASRRNPHLRNRR